MTKLEEQLLPNVSGSGPFPGESDFRYNPLSANENVNCPFRPESKTIVNRMFYINVTGVHPNDVPSFMEEVKKCLTHTPEESPEISKLKASGQWEDYFIPNRFEETVGVLGRFKNWLFGKTPLTRIEIVKVEVNGQNN